MQEPVEGVMGYIHSVETGGTVDGPGLRYVIFFQGCPLRCKYCHNPDTWFLKGGKKVLADDIVKDILRYKNFIRTGGITISGGEPLMQPGFAEAIMRGCKENGIHTAIDTAGSIGIEYCKGAIDNTDLILLDIKANDTATCKSLTSQGNENAFKLLDYACKNGKRVWIRHVIVPGITDSTEDAERLADRLKAYDCIDRVEIIPFHKMGEYKWEEMKLSYELKETPEPAKDIILKIKEIFRSRGFVV